MQEHSSKIFGDIVDALGSFIQSYFTSHVTHFPFINIAALSLLLLGCSERLQLRSSDRKWGGKWSSPAPVWRDRFCSDD